jgi:hypothetical protein
MFDSRHGQELFLQKVQQRIQSLPTFLSLWSVKLTNRLLSHCIAICCPEKRMPILKNPNGDPLSFRLSSWYTIPSHQHFGKKDRLSRSPKNNTLFGKYNRWENARRYHLKGEP